MPKSTITITIIISWGWNWNEYFFYYIFQKLESDFERKVGQRWMNSKKTWLSDDKKTLFILLLFFEIKYSTMLCNGIKIRPKIQSTPASFFLSTFFSPSHLIYYQKKRRKYCKHFYFLSPCDINFWCVNMMAWTKWNEFWSIFSC